MSKLLQIAQLGHPIIREKVKEIERIRAPEIQELIDDMIATCIDARGFGLAAPQVYSAHQVFILASKPNPLYPDAPEMEPTAIINPKIISHSSEIVTGWEGCLSIPGIRGLVSRRKTITVSFQDKSGRNINKEFDGFVARIFQHEYDHLQGIVFLDRADSKSIATEKEFQRIAYPKK